MAVKILSTIIIGGILNFVVGLSQMDSLDLQVQLQSVLQIFRDIRDHRIQCLPAVQTVPIDDVAFHLYTRINPDKPYFLETGNIQNLNESPINILWPFKIIVHGYLGSASGIAEISIRNTYLYVDNYNIILVDWSSLAAQSYIIAAQLTLAVGERIGKLMEFISEETKVPLFNFHMIGISLGGQVVGGTGGYLSGRVGRITGLDIVAPCFEYSKLVDRKYRLDSTDAKFVDIMHTTGGLIAFRQAIGHVDFYPNGGIATQPGCPMNISLLCSHGRTGDYWIDSIVYPYEFVAVQCNCWNNYKNGKCTCNRKAIMGERTFKHTRGKYYLMTNDAPPFGRG